MTRKYEVQAKVWLYPGKAAWHFISIPEKVSQEIDFYFEHVKKGWGSLPVIAVTGETEWKTSIFPDKKTQTYLLPLKSSVRDKESIKADDTISVLIEIFS